MFLKRRSHCLEGDRDMTYCNPLGWGIVLGEGTKEITNEIGGRKLEESTWGLDKEGYFSSFFERHKSSVLEPTERELVSIGCCSSMWSWRHTLTTSITFEEVTKDFEKFLEAPKLIS